MAKSPQPGWANALLLLSVTITFFLASNVVVGKITSHLGVTVRLSVAAAIAVVLVTLVCVLTSLGREIVKSFKSCCS